jgi:hypothetical protein
MSLRALIPGAATNTTSIWSDGTTPRSTFTVSIIHIAGVELAVLIERGVEPCLVEGEVAEVLLDAVDGREDHRTVVEVRAPQDAGEIAGVVAGVVLEHGSAAVTRQLFIPRTTNFVTELEWLAVRYKRCYSFILLPGNTGRSYRPDDRWHHCRAPASNAVQHNWMNMTASGTWQTPQCLITLNRRLQELLHATQPAFIQGTTTMAVSPDGKCVRVYLADLYAQGNITLKPIVSGENDYPSGAEPMVDMMSSFKMPFVEAVQRGWAAIYDLPTRAGSEDIARAEVAIAINQMTQTFLTEDLQKSIAEQVSAQVAIRLDAFEKRLIELEGKLAISPNG